MPSQNQTVPQVNLVQKAFKNLCNLIGQISCGNENKCSGANNLRMRLQHVNHRKQECQCFTRSCFIAGDDIFALHKHRNHFLMYLSGCFELVNHDVEIQLREKCILSESTFILVLILLLGVLLFVFDIHLGCLLILL